MTANELLRLAPGTPVIVGLSESHTLHGDIVPHVAKFLSLHVSRDWADVDLEEPHAGSELAESRESETPNRLAVPIDCIREME